MSRTLADSFTSFAGAKRLASGTLAAAAAAAQRAFATGTTDPVLVFDDATGHTVELDLRGLEPDGLERLSGAPAPEQTAPDAVARGRGRPKLGVVAREVTLLPRHWHWLATQPGGASVALRRLVEVARRAQAPADERRQALDRAYRFITTIAGNLPGFEEATRALFADDAGRFAAQAAVWPVDVRAHAIRLAWP